MWILRACGPDEKATCGECGMNMVSGIAAASDKLICFDGAHWMLRNQQRRFVAVEIMLHAPQQDEKGAAARAVLRGM